MESYFSVQVFFIVLREAIELAAILLVLFAYVAKLGVSQSEKTASRWQIALGGAGGLGVCFVVGAFILLVFYFLGRDLWAATEHYWEGIFSIVASIIISVMGVKLLRVSQMHQKWQSKLATLIPDNKAWGWRNTMVSLAFVTTLREGLEAIVFVGGIGVNEDTSVASVVNAALAALFLGFFVGAAMYRSGNTLSLKLFLVVSLCFLYLVAAGLFSKGVWNLELQRFIDLCGGMDVSETGHGPGSYDITRSVWHVNCCNGEMPEDGFFWMLFTAIFGWTNSATVGSVVSYNLFWIAVAVIFGQLAYEERHGRLYGVPLLWQKKRMSRYIRLPESRESLEALT